MPNLKHSRGVHFLTESSLDRAELGRSAGPGIARAEPFKTYPGAERNALPTDWDLNNLLGLDGVEESVLYLAAVGGRIAG